MVRSAVIVSLKDKASMNIRDRLFELEKWHETDYEFDGHRILKGENSGLYLVTINSDLIYSDYLSKLNSILDLDRLIFASRHSSTTKKPSLHVHFTGNWTDENPYGGSKRALSISEPIAARAAFLKLYKWRERISSAKFDASLEVTHHGPTDIDIPLFFIELGSSEEQWVLKDAARVIAEIIIDVGNIEIRKTSQVAIGFGGPHYAPSFTRYILKNDVYIGHMVPKYHVDSLDMDMLNKMINRNSVKPDLALIDWKGLKGPQRSKVLKLLEDTNLEIKKI